MKEFDMFKGHFSGDEDDMDVPLPRECGIEDDESKGIDDRMLRITNKQMKDLFDPCINRTLELIDGQVASMLRKVATKPKVNSNLIMIPKSRRSNQCRPDGSCCWWLRPQQVYVPQSH
jgi:hypothetical protein